VAAPGYFSTVSAESADPARERSARAVVEKRMIKRMWKLAESASEEIEVGGNAFYRLSSVVEPN